jgi:hypothetical protein
VRDHRGLHHYAGLHSEKSHPDEVHLFEDGIFDSVATTYWRCAWLLEVSEADLSEDASRAMTARDALDRYASLPWSIAHEPEFKEYQRTLGEIASRTGTTIEAAEFAIDCNGLTIGETE